MTAQPVVHTHPVLACLDSIGTALDAVAEVNPSFMRTGEKAEALVELRRVKARLEELELRVMAAADDVAEQTAARDIGVWLAAETRTDHQHAHADAKLAWSLDRRWQRVAAGMRAGEVSAAQARVITTALDRVVDEALPRVEYLPVERKTELVTLAETTLVDEAQRLKPKELHRVGKRILEMIAPELFEEAEARRLAGGGPGVASHQPAVPTDGRWHHEGARPPARRLRRQTADLPGGVHRTPQPQGRAG